MIKCVHHICIQTEKYEESLDFYTRLLGFELVKETPDFHGRAYNTWLSLGATMIELQTAKKGEALERYNEAGEGIVHVCLLADSVQEEYRRLKALGCSDFKIKDGQEVYRVENGYLFKVKAPEGTIVEVRDRAEL